MNPPVLRLGLCSRVTRAIRACFEAGSSRRPTRLTESDLVRNRSEPLLGSMAWREGRDRCLGSG